eukprot:symbB.v1.2.013941.t1/scaffold1003.1/size206925/1
MKKGELDTKLNRYKVGAQRLKETETVVDKLKVDLTKLQPVIEQGKKDTAALIIQAGKAQQKRYCFDLCVSRSCASPEPMGNNCCANGDAEGVEVAVGKQVRVQDMVEALHSSSVGRATDLPLLEKLEGSSWVRKSDGNAMARFDKGQV